MGNTNSSNETLMKLYKMSNEEFDNLKNKVIQVNRQNEFKEKARNLRFQNKEFKSIVASQNYEKVEKFIDIMESGGKNQIYPHKVLNLPNKFTMNQLKTSYYRLAKIFHPDMPKGSPHHFKIINDAYETLLEKLKIEEDDKQFMDLKSNSYEFMEKQKNSGLSNKQMAPSGNFNQNRFNQLFTENKINTAEDTGYGDWMKENVLEEKEVKKMSGGYNNERFNNYFDQNAPENKNEIVEYRGPTSLYSNEHNGAHELGVDKVDDFSGKDFADYKKAHTQTRLINSNIKARANYKNINDLESERSNMKPLTEEELIKVNEQKIEFENMQRQRQTNLQRQDNKSFQHFDRIHDRMIQNVYK